MWNIEYVEFFTTENINDIVINLYEKFEITEEINIQDFQYFFSDAGSEATNSNLVKLCRLFMGNLKMTYINEDETVEEYTLDSVFENMFISENSPQTRESKIEEMVDFISEFTDIQIRDDTVVITNFLEKEFRSNVEFYNQILNEIEHFYVYQAKGFYMSGFVHLYRAYEYISYAFPLTYIQNTNNFYNSYEQLKNFFGTNDNKGSELLFFERFINKVFLVNEYISEDLYTQNIEIPIPTSEYQNIKSTLTSVTNQLNGKLKEVNRILKENGASEIEKVVVFDDDVSSLQISTLAFHGFIIELRNKVFHFKATRPDSLVAKHMYFEDLFKIINTHIYNWIAMIFKFILNSAVGNRES